LRLPPPSSHPNIHPSGRGAIFRANGCP
jgi:hypothetical protein